MTTTMEGRVHPSCYDLMPVVLPESLDCLRGPTSGVVMLPITLDWSPDPTYDLADPIQVCSLYRTVVREAACPGDLTAWLDQSMLREVWNTLIIPNRHRLAWESTFPDLASC